MHTGTNVKPIWVPAHEWGKAFLVRLHMKICCLEWRRYDYMNRKAHIKLKTKMMILFLAIILVPLMCGIMVFMGFGYYENIDMLHELSKKDIMIGAIVNRRLLQYMVVAMVVILILTSSIITAWLNRDVYRPLREVSGGMLTSI